MKTRTKLFGLFVITMFFASVIATSGLLATQGSLQTRTASASDSTIKILGGKYIYNDAGSGYGKVSLSINVEIVQKAGIKLRIVIDQRDNYGNDWIFSTLTGMSYYDWSFASDSPGTNDMTATFNHGHRYGSYSVSGWIYFDHYLYGKPSTDHFKVTIQVVSGSTVKASSTIDILNTNIVYGVNGGGSCRNCLPY